MIKITPNLIKNNVTTSKNFIKLKEDKWKLNYLKHIKINFLKVSDKEKILKGIQKTRNLDRKMIFKNQTYCLKLFLKDSGEPSLNMGMDMEEYYT